MVPWLFGLALSPPNPMPCRNRVKANCVLPGTGVAVGNGVSVACGTGVFVGKGVFVGRGVGVLVACGTGVPVGFGVGEDVFVGCAVGVVLWLTGVKVTVSGVPLVPVPPVPLYGVAVIVWE